MMSIIAMKTLLVESSHLLEARNIQFACNKSPHVLREAFKDKLVRKMVKKAMKKQIADKSWHKESHPHLINSWVRTDDDGTNASYLWIIEGDINNAQRVLDELGQPWEGVRIHSDYDCTGEWFRYEADFTQLSDRTFVTQTAGMDV